jgi:hypothetical protein
MAIDLSTGQRLSLPKWATPRVLSVGWAAGALVGLTAVATWLLTGVSASDSARFIAFEALFVLFPGCLLYSLLCPRPGDWLCMFAIGWPLGYAIQIATFAASAASGQRELLRFLPLLATAAIGPPLVRARIRSGASALRSISRRRSYAVGGGDSDLAPLAAGCAIALGMSVMALEMFARYPLPGHGASVAYEPDNVFAISLAAEALHHWPIMESYIAGRPLHYYTGFFIYAAAVTQVTGVGLASTILRLFPTTIALVIALQLWVLGRELGHSRWTGALAVLFFFSINSLSLNATQPWGFPRAPFYQLFASPTYAFGVVFFLSLCILVHRRLDRRLIESDTAAGLSRPAALLGRGDRIRASIAVGILVLAGSAVKTPAIATYLGGMALYCLWRSIVARDRVLLPHFLVSLVCAGIIYRFMLSGGVVSAAFRLRPFAFMRDTLFFTTFPASTPARGCLLLCAGIVVYFVLFAPSSGALWLQRRRERDVSFAGFLISLFLTGISVYTLFDLSGGSQLWFMSYGAIAIMPLAALGLTRLWSETPGVARRRIGRACLVMLGLGLAVAVSQPAVMHALALVGSRQVPAADRVWVWYLAAYGLVGAAVLFLSHRLASFYVPAARSHAARGIPMLVTLGLVSSIGVAAHDLWSTISGQVSVDTRRDPGMTTSLYRGLLWVRAHTAPCDVLAVNFHATMGRGESLYFYFSAFAEREVFLESWTYSYTLAAEAGRQPFPAKLMLNDLAVGDGDPSALRELARQGVSYVLVDKDHGAGAREPADVSKLVFSNRALDVYRLRDGPASQGHKAACDTPSDVKV